MIQRDDRRGLGEPVALDDDEPELAPELLELGVERRGADDERPELQAEQPMDAPVAPPARRDRQCCFGAGRRPPRARRAATCSRSTSRIFGTDTSTETRRVLICATMSCGLKLRMKTTVPRQHRRNECRHRLAEHVAERQQVQKAERKERPRPTSGTSATSRSTGTMFASTLRCVMTTPLGSAVAPDVKMISATSSRVDRAPAAARRRRQSSSCSRQTGAPVGRRHRRHVLADEHQPAPSTMRLTRAEKVGRRAVVDRHDDDAAEQAAPERDDPLRDGSRRRRRPCRPCARPAAASRAAKPRAARPTSCVAECARSGSRRRRRETRRGRGRGRRRSRCSVSRAHG